MRPVPLHRALLPALMALAVAAPAQAEPTEVTVRVLSRDAKFIGTGMGGVRVTLRDAATGQVLAEGRTEGGTGDTGRIMRQPHRRGEALSAGGAAAFTATLDLDAPTRVEVVAEGPARPAGAANRVSATQWVVPGRPLTGGDGWLLVMPGFAVAVVDPPADLALGGAPKPVALTVNVTMMCGCPIQPGGLWDADRYEVRALVRRDGAPAGEVPLAYAGVTNRFSGTLTVDRPGAWEAVVYAYDPETGNTGLDRAAFRVRD
jgi:hypothetical protein